jgi:hypothetical protein
MVPSDRLPVNYELVNRLISVNDSFRHVGAIRLTLAPHPWKSCLTCTESVPHLHLKTQSDYANKIVSKAEITTFATPYAA